MEYSLLLKSHSEDKAKQLLEERYSLTGSQKPFLVLHDGVNDTKSVKPKKSHKNKRKSQMSGALMKFRKNGKPDYQTYLPLHRQWSEYIEGMADALLAADWHGSALEVKTAKNPSLVGIRGILLWESRTQFLLVSIENKFKVVPKQGTVVELSSNNGISFKIIGDRVVCRSTERTTRKFKPHEISELTPLLKFLL